MSPSDPRRPEGTTRGFVADGASELRRLLTGRSGVIVLVVMIVLLAAEALLAGVILPLQNPTAESNGYHFGPNTGAEVAHSDGFSMPSIEDDALDQSPDGRFVYAITAQPDGIRSFDSTTLSSISSATIDSADSTNAPRSIQVLSDGRIFVLSGDALVTEFVADASGKLSKKHSVTLSIPTFASQIVVAPNGKRLYAINESGVEVVDASSGRVIATLPFGGARVLAIGVASKAGTLFATIQHEIFAVSPTSLKVIGHYAKPSDSDANIDGFYHLTVSASGDRIYFLDSGEILRFDASGFTPNGEYLGGNETLSPTGAILANNSHSDLLTISSASTGADLFEIPTSNVWASPLALVDPAKGFVVAPNASGGEFDSVHLARYAADAPRITIAGMLALFAIVDVALLLLALVVVLFIPVARRYREEAPQRDALANERLREQSAVAAAKANADAAAAASADHEARVQQITLWEAAYADAHPGQPIPAMPLPPAAPGGSVAAPYYSQHTNTMAILALIFGLGGGLLGIIFGHVARSQIRRTGERGAGLATAGLVFGYLGLVATIVIVIVYVAALASLRG